MKINKLYIVISVVLALIIISSISWSFTGNAFKFPSFLKKEIQYNCDMINMGYGFNFNGTGNGNYFCNRIGYTVCKHYIQGLDNNINCKAKFSCSWANNPNCRELKVNGAYISGSPYTDFQSLVVKCCNIKY